ncbi:MAG: hypothetical protein R3F04_09100 [Lysobacteraceae bacterium]
MLVLIVLAATAIGRKRQVSMTPLRSSAWIKPAAICIGLHLLLGIAALPLITTIDSSLRDFGAQEAISAVALSNVSGTLFLIAPAGLGAREAAFVFPPPVRLGGNTLEALAQAAAAMRVISMTADGSYYLFNRFFWTPINHARHNTAIYSIARIKHPTPLYAYLSACR